MKIGEELKGRLQITCPLVVMDIVDITLYMKISYQLKEKITENTWDTISVIINNGIRRSIASSTHDSILDKLYVLRYPHLK